MKNSTWYFSRIRIYDDYIRVGFGGAPESGIPEIENILQEITQKLSFPVHFQIQYEGGHLAINNLSGNALKIGWMIIGVLLTRGWFVQELRDEGKDSHLTTHIELIDIMRNL